MGEPQDQRRLRPIEGRHRQGRGPHPRRMRQVQGLWCHHLLPNQHGYRYASLRPHQDPQLTKGGSDEKAVAILKPYGLGVRGLGGEHTPIGADGTVDISPKARFCISEAEIAIALYKGVEKVMQEESKA